jgi:hypothetical protein
MCRKAMGKYSSSWRSEACSNAISRLVCRLGRSAESDRPSVRCHRQRPHLHDRDQSARGLALVLSANRATRGVDLKAIVPAAYVKLGAPPGAPEVLFRVEKLMDIDRVFLPTANVLVPANNGQRLSLQSERTIRTCRPHQDCRLIGGLRSRDEDCTRCDCRVLVLLQTAAVVDLCLPICTGNAPLREHCHV